MVRDCGDFPILCKHNASIIIQEMMGNCTLLVSPVGFASKSNQLWILMESRAFPAILPLKTCKRMRGHPRCAMYKPRLELSTLTPSPTLPHPSPLCSALFRHRRPHERRRRNRSQRPNLRARRLQGNRSQRLNCGAAATPAPRRPCALRAPSSTLPLGRAPPCPCGGRGPRPRPWGLWV